MPPAWINHPSSNSAAVDVVEGKCWVSSGYLYRCVLLRECVCVGGGCRRVCDLLWLHGWCQHSLHIHTQIRYKLWHIKPEGLHPSSNPCWRFEEKNNKNQASASPGWSRSGCRQAFQTPGRDFTHVPPPFHLSHTHTHTHFMLLEHGGSTFTLARCVYG